MTYIAVTEEMRELCHKFKVNKDGEYVLDSAGYKIPTSVIDGFIADRILAELPIIDFNGQIYVYENGVYVHDKQHKLIKREIANFIYKEVVTSKKVNSIAELILFNSEINKTYEELNNYPKHWINFKNGMYDVLTGEMHEHNPKYLCMNQVNYCYYPTEEHTGKTVDTLLNYLIIDKEDIETIWEYFGYGLTAYFGYQLFLTLEGDGRTGKGELFDEYKHVLGSRNCSSESLEKMSTDRFSASNMLLKTCNICGEIGPKSLEDVTAIKAITGNDYIPCEFKGKDRFEFKSYAKPIFSSNKIPIVKNEVTNAFFDRMIIIGTCKKEDVVWINDIQKKLRSETDYFIHKSVEGLRRLMLNKGFTISESSKERVDKLRQSSDSIYSFLQDRVEVTNSENDYVSRSELWDAYDRYCKEYLERPSKSKTSIFFPEMEKAFGKARMKGKKRIVSFTGIKLTFEEDTKEIGSEIFKIC